MKLLDITFGRSERTTREDALKELLAVYEQRPDLQEVFPEVRTGDNVRLIDWAAHVTAAHWHDDARATLAPHARWYAANFTGAPAAGPAVDWEAVTAASACADNPLPHTLRAMRLPPGDIGDHLPTLALLVTEFRLRNIVELGVRTGVSTLALLEAARDTDGQVLSIDIEPCDEAIAAVSAAGLENRWRFAQANDLEFSDAAVPRPIELLFIDTTHLYSHTAAELQKYVPLLADDAWIVLHDYASMPGVSRAAHELVQARGRGARFYPFFHRNGLAVIRLSSAV